jgi:nitrite reductase/ring-hydroxylating ferredoxin subunit
MIEVGCYVRDLGAGLPRLIENALDWEHLPHLHEGSFEAITLIDRDGHGWRAGAVLAGGAAVDVELRLDRDRLGWVTTTVQAETPLSRIESRAEALGPEACRVSVRFYVPNAPEESHAAIGAYFKSLYAQLYDEDEAMMIARARALREGAAAHQTMRTVILADSTEVSVPSVCPHQGLPLSAEPDADGIITCPWHGYRFDVRTGHCVSGQSVGWNQAP